MNEVTRFQRSPEAVSTEPEPGQCVVLQLETGEYHSLNETATALWRLLEQPVRVEDLARTMAERFELSEPESRQEAEEFLRGLQERKLIVPL